MRNLRRNHPVLRNANGLLGTRSPLGGREFTYIGAWVTSVGLGIKRSSSSRNKTKEQKAKKGLRATEEGREDHQPDVRTLCAVLPKSMWLCHACLPCLLPRIRSKAFQRKGLCDYLWGTPWRLNLFASRLAEEKTNQERQAVVGESK